MIPQKIYEKRILLAEDDDDDSMLFKDALNEIPLKTKLKRVKDGEELMDLLRDSAAAFPDLLFLDINMPRKNGFECLDEIKRDSKLKHLPVIIFSTSSGNEIVNKMFEAGANLYIRKPNQFSQLIKIIQKTLSLSPEDLKKIQMDDFLLAC
jgi:CheY-like chemotaxis protein